MLAAGGCQQRVISRRAYSPQQFPGAYPTAVADTRSRHRHKHGFFESIMRDIGKLFDNKKKKQPRTLSQQELEAIRARRRGQSPAEENDE